MLPEELRGGLHLSGLFIGAAPSKSITQRHEDTKKSRHLASLLPVSDPTANRKGTSDSLRRSRLCFWPLPPAQRLNGTPPRLARGLLMSLCEPKKKAGSRTKSGMTWEGNGWESTRTQALR